MSRKLRSSRFRSTRTGSYARSGCLGGPTLSFYLETLESLAGLLLGYSYLELPGL